MVYERRILSWTKIQFMVPIVVLVLCISAFFGVAYAYSSNLVVNSTVTNNAELLTVEDGSGAYMPLEYKVDFRSTTVSGVTTWNIIDGESSLSQTFTLCLRSNVKDVARVVTLTVPETVSFGGNVFTLAVSGTGLTGSDGVYTVSLTPETGADCAETQVTVTLSPPSSITDPSGVLVQTFQVRATTESS